MAAAVQINVNKTAWTPAPQPDIPSQITLTRCLINWLHAAKEQHQNKNKLCKFDYYWTIKSKRCTSRSRTRERMWHADFYMICESISHDLCRCSWFTAPRNSQTTLTFNSRMIIKRKTLEEQCCSADRQTVCLAGACHEDVMFLLLLTGRHNNV